MKRKYHYNPRSADAVYRHGVLMYTTLAPDLRDMGMRETAEDVHKCGVLLANGQRDRAYAAWLKKTLIPDLRKMGLDLVAHDLSICARHIR